MPTLVLSISGARGIVGDGLDDAVAMRLARAFAGVVGQGTVIIGRDSRPSGPQLGAAACSALEASGCLFQRLSIPVQTKETGLRRQREKQGFRVTASSNWCNGKS